MDNDRDMVECTGCHRVFTRRGLVTHLTQTENPPCRQIFESFFVRRQSPSSPTGSLSSAASDEVENILGGHSDASLEDVPMVRADSPMDLTWAVEDAEDTDIHLVMDDEVDLEDESEPDLELDDDDDDEFYWCDVIYLLGVHCYILS